MLKETVDKIREFNRFYTAIIGVTNTYILQSTYSLTEVRIMFEVNQRPGIAARQLMNNIRVDEGYLSRTIARLAKQKVIIKKQSKEDKRLYSLHLSENGKKIFSELNKRSSGDISGLIRHLDETEQEQLLHHLNSITLLLTKNPKHDN